jgi:hypothetical protein
MSFAQKLLLSSVILIQGLIVYFALTDQYPPSGDDYSYLYQAKLFAQGKVFAENLFYDTNQPLHDCIETSCLTDTDGRRFPRYPPGWQTLYVSWCDQSKQRALLSAFPNREVFVYEFPGHISPYVSLANAH